jgi:hypothetical protein
MLFRLAYYSTNLIKRSPNPVQSELRKLVLSAAVKNRDRGITGGLMFNRNYFAQVLEGDQSSVSDLFCRIAKDARHRSVVIVHASSIDERVFERWSMGLAEKTETAEKINSRFGLDNGFDPTKLTASELSKYIFEMISLEDRLISVPISTPD